MGSVELSCNVISEKCRHKNMFHYLHNKQQPLWLCFIELDDKFKAAMKINNIVTVTKFY